MEKHAIGKCVKQTASECQRAVQIQPIFRTQNPSSPHNFPFGRKQNGKEKRKASENVCILFR